MQIITKPPFPQEKKETFFPLENKLFQMYFFKLLLLRFFDKLCHTGMIFFTCVIVLIFPGPFFYQHQL